MPRTSRDYFRSYKALSSKNECPLFFTDDLVTSVRGCRLSVVAVVEVRLHFNCPEMSERLLSEAEQLVLERGLVVVEPEVRFFSVYLGAGN